jgi:hypothetical protein
MVSLAHMYALTEVEENPAELMKIVFPKNLGITKKLNTRPIHRK